MGCRIAITGCGVVSALGLGKEENLSSLLEGRRGVGPAHYLDTARKEFPVGEVKISDAGLKERLGIDAGSIVPRTALLAIPAVREALEEAALKPEGAVLLSGTTVGCMDITERFAPMPCGIEDCGQCSDAIADYFGGFQSVMTPSTACSSAANSIIFGAELLLSGRCDAVVAGGSECLTKYHLGGFASLMITDHEPCRPFDASRAGLNLGEGAAYLVLEREEDAVRRGARPLAWLDGWGNACDAFHQTASSPEGDGAYDAMGQALAMASLRPSDIGYINAHGTGTPNNDASESRAIFRLFGDDVPPVSSTKGLTGHTTSASGSIEAVFCILALREGFMPASAGFSTPSEGCLVPLSSVRREVFDHALCNAFGFGGNDSSILISRAL